MSSHFKGLFPVEKNIYKKVKDYRVLVVFFLVELLKYIPELLLGFKMSAWKGRKSYDKPLRMSQAFALPRQNVTPGKIWLGKMLPGQNWTKLDK